MPSETPVFTRARIIGLGEYANIGEVKANSEV